MKGSSIAGGGGTTTERRRPYFMGCKMTRNGRAHAKM
jgi:hypothetical protein